MPRYLVTITAAIEADCYEEADAKVNGLIEAIPIEFEYVGESIVEAAEVS